MHFKKTIVVIAVFCTSLLACKKWDEHTQVTNQDLTKNLLEAVSANADLSRFRELVAQAGLDTLLQSSKTYTVWAPSNAALQTLDPAVVNDAARLKAFLMNHIANQVYFVRGASPTTRINMLNGKYISFTGSQFDDASLTSADKYVKNGVLHVISKSIAVLPSVWEFINTTTTQYLQSSYIASLNFNTFDPSQAIVDSISSTTGLPIYKPGSGIVLRNRFNDRVYDVKREDRLYTYIVIANAGFTLEADSLKTYYKATTTAETDSLTKWNTVKDLVVEGLYPPSALPALLLSKFGVSIPLNQASIIEARRVSNGMVYVLSTVNFATADKFKEITIQGESPSGFMADRTANTQYRVRRNPVTNEIFNDILVTGHGLTAYYSFYRLSETPSIKYRVFASAVNDFQTAAFAQSIVPKYFVAPSTYTTLATLIHNVPLFSAAGAYSEVLLGEFTSTSYGTIEIQLTASATNPITLNYLRLVPVP